MEIINDFRNYLLKKNISNPTTLKNYLSDLRHFVSWYEKSFGITFEPSELEEGLIKLYEGTSGASLSAGGVVNHGEKMSRASIKRRLSSLRQFARFAVENQYIEENPFELITNHQSLITNLDIWHISEFKDYLKFKKASELTVKNYVTDIHSFRRWYESAIEPHVGNVSFPVINDSIIEEYKKRLIDLKSSAPRTVNRKLSSIRKYVEFAIVSNYTNKDFFYAPTGIENLEISKEQAKISATLSLNDIEEQKIKIDYSPFPPIRLFQRLIVLPYILAETAIAERIITLFYGSRALGFASKKINSNLPRIKIPQKVSDLLKIKGYEKSFYAPNEVSLDTFPFHKKLWHHIRFTRPNWYKKYHSLPVVHYIHFAILIVFCAGVGIALYRNLVTDQTPLFAAPVSPPRILSFQGRLTDNLDNPITTATDLRFAIYNDLSASGAALLWQEVHYDTNLDQDGIFSVLLGTNTAIPDSVFFENDTIYLGVTIEQTDELGPRRRIASVPYAANSESLQGMLPITDGGAGTTNVVLALDSSGDLTIGGAATPTFAATGGQFSLSGDVLLLSTETGTSSDVIISPDGIGKIDVQKPLVNTTATGNLTPGGVEVNDKFGVLATESAVAAFIVNNNTAGGDIFTASSSGTPRFTIENDGILRIPVYATAGGIFYANGTGGLVAQTTAGSGGQCLQSAGGGATPTWGTCGSGALWRISQGAISPLNDTLDLLVGSNATESAKFAVLNVNDGTPVASISAISPTTALALSSNGSIQTVRNNTLTIGGNTTGNIILNPLNGTGKVGINTSSPLVALDVRGSSGTTAAATVSANTSFATLTVDNSGVGDLFAASASGVPNFVIKNNGDIIVGQGGVGKVTAAVIDPYLVQNQYTTGNTQLTFQTMAASNGDFIYKNQSTTLATLVQAGQLQLPITGSLGGLSIGADTQLFRGAADRLDLATGDSFNVVSGNYQVGGVTIIDSSSNATFNDITVNGTCSGCVSTGNITPFQELAAGAIVPNNSTVDFLIGGQATTSAKFAVLNVNNGTPTASVSSGLSGTSMYMTADGTLATQNRQTLTIGNSSTYNTTGNVLINPNGTGNVGIGTTSPLSITHIQGTDVAVSPALAFGLTIETAATDPALQFLSNNVGSNNLFFGDSDDADRALFGYSHALDAFRFMDAGGVSTLVTILQAGNVGIGDTGPDAKLEVLSTTEQLRLTHTDGTIDTRFTVDASGNLTLDASGDGTGSETLTLTGFGTLTGTDFTTVNLSNAALTVSSCTGCSDGSGGAFDVLSTGVTVQKNQSTDLLIGASATTSAKFAVLSVDSGTPTASVSATAVTDRPGLYMTGTGILSSVNKGTLTIGSSDTGNINIGTDATERLIRIGNVTGATSLTLNSGTGAINIGTSIAKAITIGNTTTSTSLALNSGTGGIALASTSTGDITLNSSDTLLLDSAGVLELNSSAGVISIGNDAISQNINIGTAGTRTITIGSTGSTSGIDILAGSGEIDIGDTASTKTIEIGGVDSSGTDTISIATNGTAADVIAIGNSNAATTVAITGGNDWSITSGGALTVASCTGCSSGAAGVFQELAGAIVPNNSTVDFLIGGQATTSAKFGVLNINSGTPTASISANSGNIATYLTGNGTLATTNRQSLTIGNSSTYNTTGNVLINPNGTGNVGVGTTAPEFKLDVLSGGIRTDITSGLYFSNTYTSGNNVVRLNDTGADGTFDISSEVHSNVAGNSLPITFRLSNSTSNRFEAMRITNIGTIGIGTTTPTSQLHVTRPLTFGATGKALAIFDQIENQDIFTASASGIPRFVIANSGRVGIGTVSPSELLDVEGSTATIDINATGNTDAGLTLQDNGSIVGRLFHDENLGNIVLENNVKFQQTVFNTDNGRWIFFDEADTSATPDRVRLSTFDTEPVASISGNTTFASLLVTNDGSGDLIAASVSGSIKFAVRNNGDILFTGTTIGPGADFAEYYKKESPNEIFEAGTLVCQSENSGVTKCDGNNPNHKLLGAISDTPLITGGGDRKNDTNYVLVGLVGQLKVRVAGDIKVGDPLTISSQTGIAAKATNEAVIIGYAMESNNNGSKPRVSSSVQKSYYNPNLALNYSGDDSETFIASLNINEINGKWSLTDAFGNVVNRTSAFSDLIAANIKAGFINAQKITTNAFNASTASISSLTASVINGTNATIANISTTSLNASSAVLGSVTISSENVVIAGISLRDYVASIVTETLNSQLSTLNSGGEIISPTGEIDNLATNIISPLADGASIEIEVKPENIAINNTDTGEKVVDIDNEGNARFAGDLEARRATFSGTLSSETLETNNASISGNLATDTLQTNDATISGTLNADRIIANTIDGLDDRISSIASQLVADSGQRTVISNQDSASSSSVISNQSSVAELEVGNLYADFGIYSQGLSVLGSITTAQLTAMDSIAIGTGFIMTDNSINTLGATLEIQPLRQGNISFMAGRVKIDTDGNVDINGNLNLSGIVNASEGVFGGIRTNSLATNIISPLPDSDLVIKLGNNNGASTSGNLKVANANGDEVLKISGEGNIVASGSATFEKLNFNLVGEALADSDLTATATGSAGFATVQRNRPEVTIYNDKITKDSLIYITPFGDTQNKVLHLLRQVPQSETADGSFTVGISGTPATIDIQFNWLIVN